MPPRPFQRQLRPRPLWSRAVACPLPALLQSLRCPSFCAGSDKRAVNAHWWGALRGQPTRASPAPRPRRCQTQVGAEGPRRQRKQASGSVIAGDGRGGTGRAGGGAGGQGPAAERVLRRGVRPAGCRCRWAQQPVPRPCAGSGRAAGGRLTGSGAGRDRLPRVRDLSELMRRDGFTLGLFRFEGTLTFYKLTHANTVPVFGLTS